MNVKNCKNFRKKLWNVIQDFPVLLTFSFKAYKQVLLLNKGFQSVQSVQSVQSIQRVQSVQCVQSVQSDQSIPKFDIV